MKKAKRVKTKKIFSYVGFVFLILLFSYLVFYLVFDKVSPNKTVKTLGYKSYSILSDSMEPILKKGDLIVVAKYKFSDLNEGDIVTFVDPNNNVVTHRFVRFENIVVVDENGVGSIQQVMRTKPEGEYPVDWWKIPESDFIGKLSFSVSKVGNFIMFLQSWIGIITMIIVVVIIFVIINIIGQLKKEDQKIEKTEGKEELENNVEVDIDK